MAGKGSAPGERRGGRQKGTRNKRTVEVLEAQRIEEEAKRAELAKGVAERASIKLGKDVLEDYMAAFGAIAAIYQNRLVKAAQTGVPLDAADLAGFERWGSMTAKTAKDLAEFQSPKFKAVFAAGYSPLEPVKNGTPTKPEKAAQNDDYSKLSDDELSRLHAAKITASGRG